MGRPKKDTAAGVLSRLAPPPGLAPGLIKLWHSEFSRFPPGYYVAADVNAMTLYLETVAEYRANQQRITRAKAADKPAERAELRAVRRQLMMMQRALRMFPNTRGDPSAQRNLARQPGENLPAAEVAGEAPWQRIMREAKPH